MADTFLYQPTREVQRSITPRVKQIMFGNGYKQVMPDGINSNQETWSLTFTDTATIIQTIDNFFKAKGGYTFFNWTPSGLGALEKQYLCTSWQVAPVGGCMWTITCTFEEWTGLGAYAAGNVQATEMSGGLEMVPELEMT